MLEENEKWLEVHGFKLQSGEKDSFQKDGKAWVRWFQDFRIIVQYEEHIQWFLATGEYYTAYDGVKPLEVGWRNPSAEKAVMLCIRDMSEFLTGEMEKSSHTLTNLTEFLYEIATEDEENEQ